jgi:hypothetical protein
VNEPEYDAIAAAGWTEGRNLPNKAHPANLPTGSIAIKASWRLLTDADTSAVRARYYVAKGAEVVDLGKSLAAGRRAESGHRQRDLEPAASAQCWPRWAGCASTMMAQARTSCARTTWLGQRPVRDERELREPMCERRASCSKAKPFSIIAVKVISSPTGRRARPIMPQLVSFVISSRFRSVRTEPVIASDPRIKVRGEAI